MKKILSLFIYWSLPVFAAAGLSDADCFRMSGLSVLDGDARDALSGQSSYAATVHHWPSVTQDSYYQTPGFAGVIMKSEGDSARLNPLVMCRQLALQLQYNLNNNSTYSTSSPLAVLQETRAVIDQEFSDQVAWLGLMNHASVKALAVILASANAYDDWGIIVARGVKEATEANYLPQFTSIETLTRDNMSFELRLPEGEDDPNAPVVLWKAKE